jgi:hypothetical protein
VVKLGVSVVTRETNEMAGVGGGSKVECEGQPLLIAVKGVGRPFPLLSTDDGGSDHGSVMDLTLTGLYAGWLEKGTRTRGDLY